MPPTQQHGTQLYDAHAHFAHPDLLKNWSIISADLEKIGLKYAVVNGTSPEDWADILQLTRTDCRILPAIGLHPWKLKEVQPDWRDRFLQIFDTTGVRIVGEIGLDRSTQQASIDVQMDAFCWQLNQAYLRNSSVSIHCNKAIGCLMEILRTSKLPERGIHLHAYNGPVELIPELTRLGAVFSFNAGQLKPQNKKNIARILAVPLERLLIETDAPNSLPPPELRTFELPYTLEDHKHTHPATLYDSYDNIANLLNIKFEELASQVADNFKAYFLT